MKSDVIWAPDNQISQHIVNRSSIPQPHNGEDNENCTCTPRAHQDTPENRDWSVTWHVSISVHAIRPAFLSSSRLVSLDIQTSINLYLDSSHGSILGEHNESVGAVLQIRLMLQWSPLLGGINDLLRITTSLYRTLAYSLPRGMALNNSAEAKTYPFCQEQTRKHRVDPDLWALGICNTFHQLDLGCFCHGVCHGRAALRVPLWL
jgi:hypothetical protein